MTHDLLRPGDLCLDRAGERALFTLSPEARPAGEGLPSFIWQLSTGREAAQVTFGPGTDRAPAWAPDGARFAFLSDRERQGRFRLYLHEGGAIEGPFAAVPGTVEKAVWSRDGAALFLLVADEGLATASSEGALPLRWSDPGDPEVDDGPRRRGIHRLDPDTGQTRPIAAGGLSVWDFDVGPDEVIVAIASEDPEERGWHRARLVQVAEGRATCDLLVPAGQLQSPAIDPSGRRVAVIEGPASDRNLVAGELGVIDLLTGTRERIVQDGLDDLSSVSWLSDDAIAFAGWKDLGCRWGQVSPDGTLLRDEMQDGHLGPDRSTARVEQSGPEPLAIVDVSGRPAEVAAFRDGAWQPLTEFNAGAAGAAPARRERVITWEAADGLTLSGLLVEPHGADPEALIVIVHGGPTAAIRRTFDPGGAMKYLRAGYRVFLPNYRGSTGRGPQVARAVIGDPAGGDWGDILSGVDHLIADGLAHPDRVGITGSSYGGYLSAWAAATTTRFAAAVVVSGISDLLACNYDCNHAFSEWVAGGPASDGEVRDLLIARSPIHRLSPATTPTLFLHGELDRCTPVTQARMMHAALRRQGTPSRAVIFPREGHVIEEAAHRARAEEEALAWFRDYLGPPA